MHDKRLSLALIVLAFAVPLWPSLAVAATCTLASVKGIAASDTTIVAVAQIAAAGPIPAYCRVDGFVATPGNAVNFRLGLPSPWNGKALMIGNGGFAGSISSVVPGIARSYATFSTDTGHQGSSIDASQMLNNMPKKIDYAYRGVHVTAVASKHLIQGFYGGEAAHTYFTGCSNGGRQALLEVQRFRFDFDGVIAGDPAAGELQLGFNWNEQALLATPQSALPPGKLVLITNAVVAECDAKDGLVDGLIDDPRRCDFDPATLRCTGADAPNCLTDAQLTAVKKIYAGPSNSRGRKLFPGFPVGSEAPPGGWETWISGTPPLTRFTRGDGTVANNSLEFFFNDGYLRYIALDDPTFDLRTFNFDTDPGPRERAIDALLIPADTDLSPFRNRGGKLIMYHGWADPGLTPFESVDYYREVFKELSAERHGDDEDRGTTRFFRLFMAPGMYHCAGGPGPNAFDTLTAIEQWVEKGIAPTRIVASHSTGGAVDRTRPLCAYPEVARYSGTGSINDAANFTCVKPSHLSRIDGMIERELRHDASHDGDDDDDDGRDHD